LQATCGVLTATRSQAMNRKSQSLALGMVGSSLAWLLLACGSAPAEGPNEDLRGFLELKSREVVAGEPLVVTVGLKNAGASSAVTMYGAPGTFRTDSDIVFEVTDAASAAVLLSSPRPSHARVLELHPEIIEQMGDRASAIKAGESVTAKHTVALVRGVGDRAAWLPPGRYKIQAKITIQSRHGEFVTEAVPFTVTPLAPRYGGVLTVFTPDLARCFEGNPTTAKQDISAKAEELRKRFPDSPHRQYLEYQALRSIRKAEAYLTSAEAYLKEFPTSPYGDDIQWQMALAEREANRPDKAIACLETLLSKHPQTPYRAEANELKAQIEEGKKWAALYRETMQKKNGQKQEPAPVEGKSGPPAFAPSPVPPDKDKTPQEKKSSTP
jgi:hypothetical protein